LLIKILPKLCAAYCLILSGVLLSQENELTLAVRRNGYEIIRTNRRGKWLAILARPTRTVPATTS
jgi:ribosomal protein L11 methylase PrmA